MYKKFISSDSTIILTVMQSDTDFAANQAVLIAKDVDPLRKRTLGVVSKIDRCEKGIFDKL